MDLTFFLERLLIFSICLPRIIAVFVMMPMFSRTVLPGAARYGIAISFALFIYPLVQASIVLEDVFGFSYVSLMAKEVLIGAFLGFGIAALFWAVESMGFFIDNQRGSTMASSVDPLTGSQTSPMGILMVQVITVYLFVSGAFFLIMLAIYESYILLPVDQFLPQLNIEGAEYFLRILDRIIMLALLFAAPAMVAMFVSELALGLISRFAPTLNVFFLSMPIKSAVGLLAVLISFNYILAAWDEEFPTFMTHLEFLTGLLR